MLVFRCHRLHWRSASALTYAPVQAAPPPAFSVRHHWQLPDTASIFEWRLQVCDPADSADTTCSALGDFACTATDTCKQYACNSANGQLTTTACKGICTPTKRVMSSAELDASKASISIALSAPAKAGIYSCSSVFAAATATKLGSSSVCSAGDTSLTITLGADAQVMPVDVLTLSAATALVGSDDAPTKFTGTVNLTKCAACALPSVRIIGPSTVSPACGTPPDLVLDGSYSSDSSKRSDWLRTAAWSQESGAADPVLTAAIATANGKTAAR